MSHKLISNMPWLTANLMCYCSTTSIVHMIGHTVEILTKVHIEIRTE